MFQSLTPFNLVAYRTQLINSTDMPNVEKIQSQYMVESLSAFLGQAAPSAAPDADLLPASCPRRARFGL